jgi:hypothetical protein
LNGFTISSTANPAAGAGIWLNSRLSDITIFNGHIRGGVTNNGSGVYSGIGFLYGLVTDAGAPFNVRVSGVSVSGCGYYGIWLTTGDSTLVEGCTVRTVGLNVGYGIGASTVRDSVALDCGGTGIYAHEASNCRGEATGIFGGIACTAAQNCSGSSGGGGNGIRAYETAIGCFGSSSTGNGIFARSAAFCTADCPGGTAIRATIANGCIAASGTNNVTYKYNMP